MSNADVEVEVQDEDETMDNANDIIVGDHDEDDAINQVKSNVRHRKGRGFNEQSDRLAMQTGDYDTVANDNDSGNPGPARSVEGWILFITNVHEEAQEDNMYDLFREYGNIKNMHLNLDRRTGYAKGYALVEYETFKEAKEALEGINGQELLGHTLHVDWAFVKGPLKKRATVNSGSRKTTAGTGRTTYQRR
jgi:RNA-binding protein 8A